MPNPNPPFFVQFSADAASSATIDHSQAAPGGDARRAGHTSISFPGNGALTSRTETGAPRADGLVPFYFSSVNVHFRLTDYIVGITSDYPAGSCTYNATMRHEVDEHIVNPTRIMYGFRDPLVAELNALRLPTRGAAQWVHPRQVADVEKRYMDRVRQIIQTYRNRVSAALRTARDASDSPASDQRVYGQCPAAEWNRP
jgi:hypothetical protein